MYNRPLFHCRWSALVKFWNTTWFGPLLCTYIPVLIIIVILLVYSDSPGHWVCAHVHRYFNTIIQNIVSSENAPTLRLIVDQSQSSHTVKQRRNRCFLKKKTFSRFGPFSKLVVVFTVTAYDRSLLMLRPPYIFIVYFHLLLLFFYSTAATRPRVSAKLTDLPSAGEMSEIISRFAVSIVNRVST